MQQVTHPYLKQRECPGVSSGRRSPHSTMRTTGSRALGVDLFDFRNQVGESLLPAGRINLRSQVGIAGRPHPRSKSSASFPPLRWRIGSTRVPAGTAATSAVGINPRHSSVPSPVVLLAACQRPGQSHGLRAAAVSALSNELATQDI